MHLPQFIGHNNYSYHSKFLTLDFKNSYHAKFKLKLKANQVENNEVFLLRFPSRLDSEVVLLTPAKRDTGDFLGSPTLK